MTESPMETLGIRSLGPDTAGRPIFELNGVKYFHQGKYAGDHVWQAENGARLVAKGPDFTIVEYQEAWKVQELK
jgi:hypothetical protein